mgnify:CR=1 FL=1
MLRAFAAVIFFLQKSPRRFADHHRNCGGPSGLDEARGDRVDGDPAAGDQFFIEPNVGASGDNRNAATLAGLQTAGILAGGTVSISDNYGALVADVGNRSSQIQSNLTAQTVLLDNIEADVASTSGVNLDEEAANLIKFQQAYEAAAQVIAVTDTLFQTLLSAVRR